ncbi:hypothetical protein PVAP13_3NG222469 [Panicum virgatum]|uniref:Uncharacterized protein n=1 Tax=Panicum virgatum TaxID=38727 RepID=A0A8T0U888_PANVG|nr:hypothetical protein PVAP13_3NG222469 [Panicum virgatum]
MAAPPAPPLRASWSSPIHGATMHLRHTPGRRRRSAPVKTQARKRDLFRSYWPEPYWPDPDPDRMLKHQRAFRAAMGPREPPAMFRKEKDDISKYMMEISSSSADDPWHLNNKVMALTVCTEAQKALDLASMIMDLTDSTSFGTTEFSRHIANQMVGMYTPTFCDVAKDAYHHKTIKMYKLLSFLDALRHLGAICHIVVQETVSMLNDGPMEDSINSDMRKHSHEFDKKLNNLRERFMTATESYQTVVTMDILHDGMKHAQSYISQLVGHRRVAIYDLNRAKLNSIRAKANFAAAT